MKGADLRVIERMQRHLRPVGARRANNFAILAIFTARYIINTPQAVRQNGVHAASSLSIICAAVSS